MTLGHGLYIRQNVPGSIFYSFYRTPIEIFDMISNCAEKQKLSKQFQLVTTQDAILMKYLYSTIKICLKPLYNILQFETF